MDIISPRHSHTQCNWSSGMAPAGKLAIGSNGPQPGKSPEGLLEPPFLGTVTPQAQAVPGYIQLTDCWSSVGIVHSQFLEHGCA